MWSVAEKVQKYYFHTNSNEIICFKTAYCDRWAYGSRQIGHCAPVSPAFSMRDRQCRQQASIPGTANRCKQTFEGGSGTAILVGGTGLYINAVLHGLDTFPAIPPDIKITVQDLMINQGLPGLQSFIQINDPEYFASMDQNNTRRLSRAMEVILTTGKKFSDQRQASVKPRQFEVLKYFVDDDRTQVYQRIDQRVDLMIKQGLKEEASSLFPFKHLKSLETVGYREWWHHFEGQCDQPTVIAKIKQHTRNYAKRQWTWWKPLQWPVINTNDLDQLIVEIERKLNNPYL